MTVFNALFKYKTVDGRRMATWRNGCDAPHMGDEKGVQEGFFIPYVWI